MSHVATTQKKSKGKSGLKKQKFSGDLTGKNKLLKVRRESLNKTRNVEKFDALVDKFEWVYKTLPDDASYLITGSSVLNAMAEVSDKVPIDPFEPGDVDISFYSEDQRQGIIQETKETVDEVVDVDDYASNAGMKLEFYNDGEKYKLDFIGFKIGDLNTNSIFNDFHLSPCCSGILYESGDKKIIYNHAFKDTLDTGKIHMVREVKGVEQFRRMERWDRDVRKYMSRGFDLDRNTTIRQFKINMILRDDYISNIKKDRYQLCQ